MKLCQVLKDYKSCIVVCMHYAAPPTYDTRRCGKRGTHQLHNKRALRHPANGTVARGSSEPPRESRHAIAIVSDLTPQI